MMMLLSGFPIPQRAMRQQIAAAVNMVVHVARLSDGIRKVIRISEITGMEGEMIMMQDLFEFNRTDIGPDGTIARRLPSDRNSFVLTRGGSKSRATSPTARLHSHGRG